MILRLLLPFLRMRDILLGAQTLVISVDLYTRAASIHLSFVFLYHFRCTLHILFWAAQYPETSQVEESTRWEDATVS